MTREELAKELGVTTATIETWQSEGMPFENGQYEFTAVSQWLITAGYAESPEQKANTVVELSHVLGVSQMTASSYKGRRGFPAGPPWSVSAVMKWQELQTNSGSQQNTNRDELDRIKLETAKLKLQKEQGDVIALADVIDELTRVQVLAKQKTKKLVYMLLDVLPADTDPRLKADYVERAERVIADLHEDLATAWRDAHDGD